MVSIKSSLIALLLITVLSFAGCSNTQETTSESVEESQVEIQRSEEEKVISENENTIVTQTSNLLVENGLYVETISYDAPPGEEEVEVSIEFKEDIVTSLTLTPIDAHPTSEQFIEKSESGLQDLLIGKNINDIEVPDKISGSSLTTKAFKDKLQGILDEY